MQRIVENACPRNATYTTFIKPILPNISKGQNCQPSDEPHAEGGGDEDAIVFFSIRGNDGVLYEILDDDLNVIAKTGIGVMLAWRIRNWAYAAYPPIHNQPPLY